MTNEEMARAYRDQGMAILTEAESLYQRRFWNLVVRRAQEVVELALKGAFPIFSLSQTGCSPQTLL